MTTLGWWVRRWRARRALRRAEWELSGGYTPARYTACQLARMELRRLDLNRP